jgi:ribosomal protein S18 acetylase RimI-like enzyme
MGHPSDDEALHALDQAWAAYHLAYARTSFSRLHDDEDCLWYESDIGFLVFGGVIRPRFTPDDVDRRINEIVAALGGQPHHWLVTPACQPSDLAKHVLHAGGETIGMLFGMAMELSQLAPAPALPTGVEIRPANDDASVRVYTQLYAQLFDSPRDDWIAQLADAEVEIFHSAHDPFHRYLAYEHGRAIAAGATCQDDGWASLETLSTLPECRGRGIGAALATHALQKECDQGAALAAVWSSDGAQHLYRRMGFRDVCTGTLLAV